MCACGRLFVVTADVPSLPVHSVHDVGSHHHATETLLDASFVFDDISAGIQAGLWMLSVHQDRSVDAFCPFLYSRVC